MNNYVKVDYLLKCARLARQLSTNLKKANHYELLGVSANATQAEIKNAYFEKTKLYHPDVVTPTEENLRLFRQISEAYEVLGSPSLRKDYDKNILGISKEDYNESEDDPISNYQRRMARNDKMYNWTKDHCDALRRQQYTYRTSNHAKTKTNKIEDNTSRWPMGLTLAVTLVIFIISDPQPFLRKKLEKLGFKGHNPV